MNKLNRDILEALLGPELTQARTFYAPCYATVSLPAQFPHSAELIKTFRAKLKANGFQTTGTGHPWSVCIDRPLDFSVM
jgi:hypothetical protein